MLGKINWSPNKTQMRWFGAIFMAGFLAFAFYFWRKGNLEVAQWLAGIGLIGGLWALLLPGLAQPLYWLWMAIGMVIGAIVSRIIICVIFYLILTPVALFFRSIKRDSLKISPTNREKETHWETHPEITDKSSYEHLF